MVGKTCRGEIVAQRFAFCSRRTPRLSVYYFTLVLENGAGEAWPLFAAEWGIAEGGEGKNILW